MRIVCKSTAMTLKGCSHSLSQTLNNASCGVSTDFTNFVKQCLHNARNALSLLVDIGKRFFARETLYPFVQVNNVLFVY